VDGDDGKRERKRKAGTDGGPDGRGQRKRKKRDATLPKLARSAYLFFCASERPKIRAERPTETMSDLMKLLGARWQALSSDDRAPFEQAAAADRARYTAAMADHVSQSAASATSDPISE
jgi:structure-specific recognition protein 1